jgi:hypothetical protein
MPRRVIDGIGSETVRRRLWCIAASSLAPPAVSSLAGILRDRGYLVELLAASAGPGGCASVPEACARHGVTAADAVLVSGTPEADLEPFSPGGARLVLVGPGRPARGVLGVRDPAELAGLLAGQARYGAASTYHEI